jgi:hypothetical protein
LAAGIAIGRALPHSGKTREGTKFFRQLADETVPEKPHLFGGVLAARLHHKFGQVVLVLGIAPSITTFAGGNTSTDFCFAVVPKETEGLKVDRQALLREVEDYLKDLAGATGAEGVTLDDIVEDGKKVGFDLRHNHGSARAYPEGSGSTLVIWVSEPVKR